MTSSLRVRLFVATAVAASVVAAPGGSREAIAGEAASSGAVVLEPPRFRQGYYMSMGIHALMTEAWDHGHPVGVWPGSIITLRAGQLLTRRFGLGLQIDSGGTTSEGGSGPEKAVLFGISMAAQWEIATNFAAHAGAGLGVFMLTDKRDPDAALRGAFGAGYSLGMSYDWFPRKRRRSGGLALIPFGEAHLIPGQTVTSLAFLAGLQIGWWTGLPDNQLALPESEAYRRK